MNTGLRYIFTAISGLILTGYPAEQSPEQANAPDGIYKASILHTEKPQAYEIGGKKFTVPVDVKYVLKDMEKMYNIPFKAMIAVCARESNCKPKSVNPSSKACGLFQLMTNKVETLYEILYKYGAKNGYEQEAEMVERYVRNDKARKKDPKVKSIFGYRPVNNTAKQKIIEQCLDPRFNTTMWVAYQKPHINKYNEWLGNRTITAGELTAMNNLGRHGLQAFTRQAWSDKKTDKNTLAVDFFKAHKKLFGGNIEANRTIIYNKDGSYKTVRQSYGDIMRFGGYGELKPVQSTTLTQ